MVPSYLIDYTKLSPIQMGQVTSAIGFGGFFGQLVLPGASDLIGRKSTAVVGFLVGAVFIYAFAHAGRLRSAVCAAVYRLLFLFRVARSDHWAFGGGSGPRGPDFLDDRSDRRFRGRFLAAELHPCLPDTSLNASASNTH